MLIVLFFAKCHQRQANDAEKASQVQGKPEQRGEDVGDDGEGDGTRGRRDEGGEVGGGVEEDERDGRGEVGGEEEEEEREKGGGRRHLDLDR